jgi:hypothetical protein
MDLKNYTLKHKTPARIELLAGLTIEQRELTSGSLVKLIDGGA